MFLELENSVSKPSEKYYSQEKCFIDKRILISVLLNRVSRDTYTYVDLLNLNRIRSSIIKSISIMNLFWTLSDNPPPSWTAFNRLVILKEWFLILWVFIVINLILAGAWWGEIAGTVVLCVVYSVRIIAVDWNLESKQVWKVKMRWIKSIILV